jgi:hypothetical protein
MADATATTGPTAPVPKDPQPSVDRIDELARRILTGDILLPKFQRNFVWERPQILSLLDSVARGYPIGSVLLWQSRQELRSENRIADLEIQLPRPDYPVNYLLDGQQRLSTICGAMYWTNGDPKSRWNLAYDLREEKFLHLDTTEDPPQHQIRVNKLADPATYFQHVGILQTLSAPDKDELARRANLLFNRFKDYKIATVTLGDMSIDDVAPIFERINSMGTPLTIVDLMRAATWSPDFDLIDSIEDILDALKAKGFGAIDRKVVLRNIAAAAGGGFSTDSIDALRNFDSAALKTAVDAVGEAYKRMVDFLTTQLLVPGGEVIPYSNQLTVLGEVFRRISSPTSDQYLAIQRWFWRTALGGYFSGWNTGSMRSDLDAVKAFADGKTEEIDVAVRPPGPDVWITRQFRLNNAHAKLLAIVLAFHEPVDLLTGQNIDTDKALAWGNSKEFHHFFPQAYLKREKVHRSRIGSLANFVMLTSSSNKAILDRAPSEYLPDVEAAAGGRLAEWLDANLITDEAYAAAKNDDYASFLAHRAWAIHRAVMPVAGWAADDTKPDVTSVSDEEVAAEAEDTEFAIDEPAGGIERSVGPSETADAYEASVTPADQ